jgi:hypothetical protein
VTDVYSNDEAIPFNTVSSITCGDPIYDGPIKGFLIGGIPTMLFLALVFSGLDDNPDPETRGETDNGFSEAAAYGLGIGGSVGALVGLLIDSSHGNSPEEIDINELRDGWK